MTEQSSIKNGHNNQMSFIISQTFYAHIQQLSTTSVPCDTQEVCPTYALRDTCGPLTIRNSEYFIRCTKYHIKNTVYPNLPETTHPPNMH